MTAQQFDSPLDKATFFTSAMFGGIELMSARFVRHSFAPHTHDELMIGIIQAGVKSFRRGRSREYAAPGCLSVVNAGEMHTGEREQGAELVYAALYVPEAAIVAMTDLPGSLYPVVGQPVVDDPEVWDCLGAAHRLAMAGEADAAEEAMTWGISLLFQRYGTGRSVLSETAACPVTVNRAMEFLHSHAGDRVSLDDASKAAGVGPFHLIRLFQKHLGLTPYAYLTQIRVGKSRHLLKLGQPAAQVALDVGFADQAHFTKRFKQLTGTTPAFYARSTQ